MTATHNGVHITDMMSEDHKKNGITYAIAKTTAPSALPSPPLS